MRFRAQLLVTMAVQGVGATSVLLAILLLGNVFGPEQQGVFSRVKSEIEFVAALSLFGLPQSIFFYANSGQLDRNSSLRMAACLTAIGFCIAFAYSTTVGLGGITFSILFGAAVGMLVSHGVLRVLVLAQASSKAFNVVTATPQALLLLLVICIVISDSLAPWQMPVVFFAAYLVGSLVSGYVVFWRGGESASSDLGASAPRVSLIQVLIFGAAAWVAASLLSGATVLWLRHTQQIAGLVELGVLTIGFLMIQVILTPFNFAAPLLFKHWMHNDPAGTGRVAGLIGVATFVLLALSIKAAGIFHLQETLGDYRQLWEIRWHLAGAAAAEVALRIMAPVAYSRKKPWLLVAAESARITVLLVVLWSNSANSLSAIALSWAVAAVFSSCLLLTLVSLTNQSLEGRNGGVVE